MVRYTYAFHLLSTSDNREMDSDLLAIRFGTLFLDHYHLQFKLDYGFVQLGPGLLK